MFTGFQTIFNLINPFQLFPKQFSLQVVAGFLHSFPHRFLNSQSLVFQIHV